MGGIIDGIDGGWAPVWTVTAFREDTTDREHPMGTASAGDLDNAADLVCAYLPRPEDECVNSYFLIATRSRSGKPSRLARPPAARAWISTPTLNAGAWSVGPWNPVDDAAYRLGGYNP